MMELDTKGESSHKIICGYWGRPGNHIYAALSCHCHKNEEQKMITSDKPVISHFTWDADMHKGKLRKLISESRVIFLETQKALKNASTTATQLDSQLSNQLLSFSHQYLSALKSCATEIQGLLKFEKNEKAKNSLLNQLKMLEMTELLWSLCEIIYIDNTREVFVLGQLLDWLRLRFYDGDLKVREVVESKQGEGHDLYWEVMFMFVLQGRIEEARGLLTLHSRSRSELYRRMDLLLGQMPIYLSNGHLSFSEWTIKWKQWHITCEEHIEDAIFIEDQQLNSLCEILAGRDDAFVDQRNLLGTWYCMLISKLFYQAPMIMSPDLRYYTVSCINAFGGPVAMTSWDKVILSILHLDIKQAIDECCLVFNNWWFICHMTDLLEQRGCLESKILPFGSNLREFVMLEYANSLISDPSFLEVGINYLSHCPVFGRGHIAELLLRTHLETETKVRKMIRICEKYGLNDEAGIICREQGLKDLRRGLIGSSLYWSIRSKDADFSAAIVKKVLADNPISPEELSKLNFINNFGSSIGFSNELALLGKLAEYQNHYNNGRSKKAAEVLCMLFSERTSKRFWSYLLDQLVIFLSSEDVAITREQTTTFLECLADHELLGFPQKVNPPMVSQEQILKVRRLLADNLALAFVNEV